MSPAETGTSSDAAAQSFMRKLPAAAFGIAALAALGALASGLGHRFGLWGYGFGFLLLRVAAWTGLAGALACAAAAVWAVRARALGALLASLVGLAAGGAAFGVPWAMIGQGRGAPPIHDITSDTAHPPQFVALAEARRASPNGLAYGGAAVAELQHRAYPGIVPLALGAHPEAAFQRCLDAARGLGWRIVSADPAALRIEATATTPFFGFKDDIVIRITPLGGASRVDVRSASREGRGDLGTNARRIRAFYRELARRG